MRLVMYQFDTSPRAGIVQGNAILDLAALADFDPTIPRIDRLIDLIDAGEEALLMIRAAAEAPDIQGRLAATARRPLKDVEILAPFNPPTGNIICIGRNYYEHAVESARARGEEVTRPSVFTKAQTSITGPYADIRIDSVITSEVDWETELAVVMGRKGVNIPREQALDYVFGYTVLNDVSARDIQYGWGGQFFKGKSLDTFCPIGPWVVTADEVPDPQNLRLLTRVNDVTKQDANTGDMILSVAELIAQLSLGMTLLPGTLIATGTPAGVGFARDPREFLQPGDALESEIEGIGVMRNRLVLAEG